MSSHGIGRFVVLGSFWFFVALVALSPLPYGAAHIWSYSLLSILAGVALVLWVVAALFDADTYTVPFERVRIPAVLLAVVLIWIVVQSSPVVPTTWHHPLWSDVRLALGDPSIRGAISLNPDGAPHLLARLGTYAAVFWLAMQYGRSAPRANVIFWAIAIAGFAYGTYGIWAHLSGSGKILFADKWAYGLSLTSTFVHRNHYAVFAGMGLIISFALTIRYLKRDTSGAFDSSRRFLNSMENLSLPVFVLITICIVIGSALLLTQSRGGVIFTAAGLVVLVILLRAGGTLHKRSSLALVGGLMGGGLVVFAVSGGDIVNRVAVNLLHSGRGLIHQIAIEAIADAPLTGHGAGSFPALFYHYRDAGFPAISPAYASAHGVYLELASDLGLVAAGLYFGMLLLIATRCVIGARDRRRNQIYPAAGGAIAVMVAAHSYFDFGPQVPGVAVTFAALLGVAYAQSWPSENRRNSQSADR